MRDNARKLAKDARQRRQSGDLLEAADRYTAAAHEYAGTVTEHVFPGSDSTVAALGALLNATTCYRIGGDTFRTQNRCDLGIVLAEEYIKYIEETDLDENSFADFRRGAWSEFIGDLRTIARRDDAKTAYDDAIAIYRAAGDEKFVFGEKEHMRLAAFFRGIRRGLGHDIPHDAPEQQPWDGPLFSEWVEYKRETLPDLLAKLEAQGTWPRSIDPETK